VIDFTCRIFLVVTRACFTWISSYLGWFGWFIGKQGWGLLRFNHAEGFGGLERGHANIHIHTNIHPRLREPWSIEQQSSIALKLNRAWGNELNRTHGLKSTRSNTAVVTQKRIHAVILHRRSHLLVYQLARHSNHWCRT